MCPSLGLWHCTHKTNMAHTPPAIRVHYNYSRWLNTLVYNLVKLWRTKYWFPTHHLPPLPQMGPPCSCRDSSERDVCFQRDQWLAYHNIDGWYIIMATWLKQFQCSVWSLGYKWWRERWSGLASFVPVAARLEVSTGFCRIFATELEDRRPKTVPYLEEVVE